MVSCESSPFGLHRAPFTRMVSSFHGERERECARARVLMLSGVSSYKDTNVIVLGPTLMTSFNLNYFPTQNTAS